MLGGELCSPLFLWGYAEEDFGAFELVVIVFCEVAWYYFNSTM